MITELRTERDVDNRMYLVNEASGNPSGLESKESLDEHRNTVLELRIRNLQFVPK